MDTANKRPPTADVQRVGCLLKDFMTWIFLRAVLERLGKDIGYAGLRNRPASKLDFDFIDTFFLSIVSHQDTVAVEAEVRQNARDCHRSPAGQPEHRGIKVNPTHSR